MFKTELFRNQHRLTEAEIEKVKQIVFEILCDVADVCEKYRIPYMLGGGTALGAVRHGGFIPWDEDIDINVPKKHTHELCEFIRKEFPGKYYIEEPIYTKGYLSSFIQIHKNGTVFQEYLVQDLEQCGIKIDIFPIENTYNNWLRRRLHGIRSELGLFILSCYRMFAWRKEMLALASNNIKATFVIRLKGAIGCVFVPFHSWWYRHIQLIFQKCKDENSKYVVIPSGRKHFFGEIYERDWYMETEMISFENRMFPIAKGYDKYLKNLYGDYMTLPPKNKREHHVIYKIKF